MRTFRRATKIIPHPEPVEGRRMALQPGDGRQDFFGSKSSAAELMQ
jgi:hypothetical protein